MVGPGIVIDKKTQKKMKKAHKKSHKHHKHGKVSVLWSLAGDGTLFRGTRGDQELRKGIHSLWAREMAIMSLWQMQVVFPLCKRILLKAV